MNDYPFLKTLLPCALTGAVIFSVLSVLSYLEGNEDEEIVTEKEPALEGRPTTPLPSRTNDQSLLDTSNASSRHLSGYSLITNELSEIESILNSSPTKRRMAYDDIASRFPVSSRLSNVIDALEDLKQIQDETEAMLEGQKRLTGKEQERRLRAEESLKAESRLREEAENEIQIYQTLVQRMRECEKCKEFFQEC